MVTPLRLTGFEHGSVANAVVFDNVVDTPAIQTGVVRTGTRALEIDTTVAKSVSYTVANQIVVSAFYVRFATLPAADARLAFFNNATQIGSFNYAQAANRFQADCGGATTNGTVAVTTDTWYRVVLEYETTSTAFKLRAKVDADAFEDNSTEAAATNSTTARLGSNLASTFEAFYDDWFVSVTDGDFEEVSGWVSHSIPSLIPTADGTHNITTLGDFDSFTGTAFNNSTTNGNTFIGHRPLQLANTANQVIRQELGTTANYMELLFENPTYGAESPVDVQCYGTHVEAAASGASLGEMRLMLSDSTEVLTTGSISMINSTEDPGTTVTLRDRMAIRPSGDWDTTKVDGLKVRLGFGDNAPDVNFIDCMVEVLLFQAVAAGGSLLYRPNPRQHILVR